MKAKFGCLILVLALALQGCLFKDDSDGISPDLVGRYRENSDEAVLTLILIKDSTNFSMSAYAKTEIMDGGKTYPSGSTIPVGSGTIAIRGDSLDLTLTSYADTSQHCGIDSSRGYDLCRLGVFIHESRKLTYVLSPTGQEPQSPLVYLKY